MKNNFKTLTAIGMCLLLLAACTKTKDNNTTTSDPKQHNQDVNNVKSESDNSNSDINTAVNGNSTFGKNGSVESLAICGGSVDTTPNTAHSVTITYDGSECYGRRRTGQIIITLVSGTHWSDQGAVLKITYKEYKVIFINNNNHYVTFNGTKYLTDVNGITWATLITGGSLGQIKERGDSLSLTFEDNTSRVWGVARKTTYLVTTPLPSLVISSTVDGDSITPDNRTLDTWGTTRFGTHFSVQVNQAWQSNSACGWWKPIAGMYTCVADNFTLSATFGVNSSGVAINATDCTAYGYKLDWTINANNSTGEAILPYW